MKAAEDGNESIISQLLLENVDINAVNNKGRTAMSFAASPSSNRPSKIGALTLLLNLGADSSCLDHQGYSAESRAFKEHRWAAVNVFKSHRKGSTQRTSNSQLSGRLSLCDDDVS
jgi:ankyrin repeat protein